MGLDPKVADRMQRDFPDELQATVCELLESCGADFGGRRESVQHAILELAGGKLELIEHHVEVSRTDFRDVLYWAFGRDTDPRRLLWNVRQQLVEAGIITQEEDSSLGLIGTHQGLPAELVRLCEYLSADNRTVSTAQFEAIQSLSRRFRLRAQVWQALKTNDR